MIYDLTHTIEDGIPFYPGDPVPHIEMGLGMRPWCVSALQLGSHSGTHVDAPLHYFPGSDGLNSYKLERFIRPGLVIDARGHEDDTPLGAELLHGYSMVPGMIVVIRTGWEAFWREPRYFSHPFLSEDLAYALLKRGVSLVAIDALNVDSTPQYGERVHAILLGADVLIAENMCGLEQLICGQTYIFAFLPLALGNIDGAPIRALAWDQDHHFTVEHS